MESRKKKVLLLMQCFLAVAEKKFFFKLFKNCFSLMARPPPLLNGTAIKKRTFCAASLIQTGYLIVYFLVIILRIFWILYCVFPDSAVEHQRS